MKKLLIKSYGCQMNVYDSARMADLLAPLGYEATEDADGADMVVLNTCHIREKASEKVFSELGRLKAIKDRRPHGISLTIVVAGCVAQAEGAEIQRRQPAVDIVVGPQAYHRLPELIAQAARLKGHVLDTDFPPESKFDHLPSPRVNGPAAFLTIQEGCDKFCSFCVVPYTRGAEVSRPIEAILTEARSLVASGGREITLLGQNVNAYRAPDGTSFAALLEKLSAIPELDRLSYMTSHPRDMDDELIAAHGRIASLMPFLHLPVQSGSNRILAAMNRKHDAGFYLDLVEKIRKARPDIALSSDFIVGFPGESERDFEATLALIDQVGFAQAYSFKYSPRPGTPAATLAGQVPEEIKTERLARLQARLADHSLAFNRAQIGRTLPVLFERTGRREGQSIGRSPYLQSVVVDRSGTFGRILDVKITDAGPNSLKGDVRDSRAAAAA